MTRLVGLGAALALLAACATGTQGGSSSSSPSSPSGNADAATQAKLQQTMNSIMDQYKLKAFIVRVTKDGQDYYTSATGEALKGVPATPALHFRNGSMAFTYIGEIFAKLIDAKKVSLDDKLSTWFPNYPRANQVTVKNLLNMTSGYADYVYQPVVGAAQNSDPWKQWTTDELVAIGLNGPEQFAPGTNWGYSHTNYAVLAQVLEKLTGKPMAAVMQEYIIGPMNLTQTGDNAGTPLIPEPAMHAFTIERSEYFKAPAKTPIYEESTYWNPSWSAANGAVQTTNIYDMTTSMEIIGSGSQVSKEMYAAQTDPNLIGVGKKDPSGKCQVCRPNTATLSYGLGVFRLGSWITQTKSFAGSAATTGYLPSDKLAVSVAMTYNEAAFVDAGNLNASSIGAFRAVIDAVAQGKAPEQPKA